MGLLRAFPAVFVSGAVDCLRLCAAVGGSVACFGACLCPCTLARLRGSVRPLWRLWRDCTRAGLSGCACGIVGGCPGAVPCPASRRGSVPGRRVWNTPAAFPVVIARAGRLWAVVELDREKPGQAVQAPPGRKRTAAGIAPGAALWFHLFIFKSSEKIANGIIKTMSKTNT